MSGGSDCLEINTDTMRAANDSLSSGAEAHALQGSLYAIPPFIWLCFLKESKLEPLTSAAQVKERGRRKREREGGGKKKKSFISCTSGLELHLELIIPPSSSKPFLTATA